MPVFRVTAPGQQPELLEADTARVEGGHTVLYGQAVVIGRIREVVVRRVPLGVEVERMPDDTAGAVRASWLV